MYGQAPPLHLPYLPHDSQVEEVDRSFMARKQILKRLKENLKVAVNRMKQQANKGTSERTFEVGEWVFLKLQAYRQVSVRRKEKDNQALT